MWVVILAFSSEICYEYKVFSSDCLAIYKYLSRYVLAERLLCTVHTVILIVDGTFTAQVRYSDILTCMHCTEIFYSMALWEENTDYLSTDRTVLILTQRDTYIHTRSLKVTWELQKGSTKAGDVGTTTRWCYNAVARAPRNVVIYLSPW